MHVIIQDYFIETTEGRVENKSGRKAFEGPRILQNRLPHFSDKVQCVKSPCCRCHSHRCRHHLSRCLMNLNFLASVFMYDSFYFCRILFIQENTNIENIDIILFVHVIDSQINRALRLTRAAATPMTICSLVPQFNGVLRGSAKTQTIITKSNWET